MNWFKTALKAVGAVVDAVVPVGVGSRTKFAVLACPLLGFVTPIVAAIPGGADFLPLIPLAQKTLCTMAPAFAAAGVARNMK